MLLGAHESVAGGAWNAIARGRADGCEAVQIFARPAQQWRARPMPPDEVSMFRSEHATVGWPAMSHASYLINLCAGDPVILEKSVDALEEELLRAEELGLDFVVLHPGAHLGAGREEAAKLETDAQHRLSRADAALAEARRVGAGERAVARAEAHAREQTLLAEANAAAQRKVAEARGRLNAAIEAERKKLEAESSEVAMAAARKILGREVGA